MRSDIIPHQQHTSFAHIPTALRERRQWVCWRLQPRPGGKPGKVPYSPASGRTASPTDPATWGAFDEAVAAHHRDGMDGIGYVFTADDSFCGIDLDGVRDPATGGQTEAAAALVERFESYTEASDSGTGVHIIIEGRLPGGGKGRRVAGVELYDRGRFFAMTGQALHPWPIQDRQAALEEMVAETEPTTLEPLTDDALVVKARAAYNGAKFDALWRGDTTGYPSPSEADLALVAMLWWRTDGDEERVDRLFRRSGLMREKWERADYRAATMAKARQGGRGGYRPAVAGEERPTDAGAPLPDDVPTLERMIRHLERQLADLRKVQSRAMKIIGNTALGPERVTAAFLTFEFANREAAGLPATVDGWHVPMGQLAARTGLSRDRMTAHIDKLERAGVLRHRTVFVPERVDRETGEIVERAHREVWLAPTGGGAVAFAEACAGASRAATDPKPGGRQVFCPDHPNAPVIERRHRECSTCHRLLGEDVAILPGQPAIAPEPPGEDPTTTVLAALTEVRAGGSRRVVSRAEVVALAAATLRPPPEEDDEDEDGGDWPTSWGDDPDSDDPVLLSPGVVGEGWTLLRWADLQAELQGKLTMPHYAAWARGL